MGIPQRHGFSAPSVHGERVGPTGSPAEASFPSPKGGDIPLALLDSPPSALGRGGGRRNAMEGS